MKCDFSSTMQEGRHVRIDGQVVPKTDTFCYLESILQKNGDIDEDVSHRIKVAWLKWSQTSSALCDPMVLHMQNVGLQKGDMSNNLASHNTQDTRQFWLINRTFSEFRRSSSDESDDFDDTKNGIRPLGPEEPRSKSAK
jgi:hypothetical protein